MSRKSDDKRVVIIGNDADREAVSLLIKAGYVVRHADDLLREETIRRKQWQEEFHRLNRILKARTNSTRAIMRIHDEIEYLQEVCRIVVEDCGHAMVSIGFAENDEAKTFRPVAHYGFEEGYLETLNITWANTERGRGPTGMAIRTGKPSICRNMSTDPKFKPWRKEALKRGYASSIVLPLIIDNKPVGAITIYSLDTDSFSDDEISLLTELADDISYGIATIRLRAEHARVEEDLLKQKDLLAALAANTTAHLVYLDRDFNFLWVNPAYARVCARTQEEFIGHNHFEFYPDKENQEIFERVRDTGIPYEAKEKPFIFPDHQERGVTYWNWMLTPIKDSSGTVQNLVFSLMEVTNNIIARKEIELLRKEAERRAAELESFITSMSDGVVMMDREGNTVLSNNAAADILGAEPGVSLEYRVRKYLLRDMDEKPMKPEETASYKALHGETVNNMRCKILSPQGKEIVISLSSSPVRDADGRVLGAATVIRNVTNEHEFALQREELLQREHHIAEMLQQALIPPYVPTEINGFRIGVRYQPALKEAEVGGDFYDVFEIGNGKIGILIGDVAGKGLPAAIRVAAARYSIRSYAFIDPRPSHVLTLANETLCRDTDEAGMLTAFFAVADTANSKITYANAGHEPPLVCRASGVIEELWLGGMPLGVSESGTYQESSIDLSPGDTIIIVTDGITEARATGSVMFEKKGIIEYLANGISASPDETASGLLSAATVHAGGQLQDDAAVVVISMAEYHLVNSDNC